MWAVCLDEVLLWLRVVLLRRFVLLLLRGLVVGVRCRYLRL
jgi:hypothetical protein